MNTKTLLIVDDEAGFAKTAKLVLEQTGEYTVKIETHSSRAVETARAVKPDLILLDLIMPEKDGAEVQMDLQKDVHLRSTPILFITSNVSKNDTEHGVLVNTADGLMLPKTTPAAMIRRCIKAKLAGTI